MLLLYFTKIRNFIIIMENRNKKLNFFNNVNVFENQLEYFVCH